MAIEISLLKSPANTDNAKACQIFTENGGTIGRGASNTWVLDDPERFISTVHSRIVCEAGQYYLVDLSTNGTFYNGASEPIGNGNRVQLRDGDKFMLGDYEFSVLQTGRGTSVYTNSDDPFGAGEYASHSSEYGGAQTTFPESFSQHDDPFALPSGFSDNTPLVSMGFEEMDPLAALDNASRVNRENPFMPSYGSDSQADNADAMQQAVSWPNLIPDDWDGDEVPFDDEQIQDEHELSLRAESKNDIPGGSALRKQFDVAEQRNAALESENEKLLSDVIQLRQKLKNLENKQALPPLGGQVSRFDGSLIDALGLGDKKLSEQKKADISATVGLLMRESIAGLMQTLSFRKKIKEEFRINVTTIQPVENNPLKFSANIEDAIENMFLKDNRAYMHPLDAVREGFHGISEHQVAVLAGIQAAFRGMIERLDPESLEKRFEKYRKTGVIKVGQKGKNWESYKEFHSDLVNNMDNSFQYYFGYDFVQAYEEQLQRLVMMRKSKASKTN